MPSEIVEVSLIGALISSECRLSSRWFMDCSLLPLIDARRATECSRYPKLTSACASLQSLRSHRPRCETTVNTGRPARKVTLNTSPRCLFSVLRPRAAVGEFRVQKLLFHDCGRTPPPATAPRRAARLGHAAGGLGAVPSTQKMRLIASRPRKPGGPGARSGRGDHQIALGVRHAEDRAEQVKLAQVSAPDEC